MPPTPLEIIESIDMLRILEHGLKLEWCLQIYYSLVDTPQDLKNTRLMEMKDFE